MSDLEFIDSSVQIYLREACDYPPMSREEEIECERLLRTGDQKAGLRLAEANLAMVVAVAQRFGNQQIHILDLIIVGNDALRRALKTFGETSSGTFTEHAAACVEKAIVEASRATDGP